MSVLSYICDYGSDSEDTDREPEAKRSKTKLPGPRLEGVRTIKGDVHVDDPELHKGRTRSFPHERGNWATFVYVKYPEDSTLLKYIAKIETAAASVAPVERIEDVHVSLSRTVVLKYHMIASFNSTLKSALDGIQSFDLELDSIKVYSNEDKSRTFVALKVDHFSNKFLLQIMKQVDQTLREYNLPEFYEDPSFHASILWTNGNKQEELTESLKHLQNLRNNITLEPVFVDKIYCKIGNKQYQYLLD
ncbi:U6 snRNA phosphodiesterase 1 [Plutella xylostella]|uniref:U6 snRNA phosphodiesterase 1 n=1 Tax=Plutella xylostella TaxID=51655 RepID=UPI002032383D|nr:U6 snRNA phosphodiesterase 1 [Plutella xylostella]